MDNMSSISNHQSSISNQKINPDLYNEILHYHQNDETEAEKSAKKVMECCERIIEEAKKNEGEAVIEETDNLCLLDLKRLLLNGYNLNCIVY